MRVRKFAAVLALAVSAVTFGSVAAHAAAVNGQPAAMSWSERTCHAFSAWERHPSAGRLDTLGADSLHVPWRYLGADVWGLVSDVRSGSVKYVSDDETYIYEDCNNGSGL